MTSTRSRFLPLFASLVLISCGGGGDIYGTFKDPGVAVYRKADDAPGYYINSVTGNDTFNGRSPATAWKTLTKLNATDLNPGDVIHLARGSEWKDEGIFLFSRKRAGTAAQPIVFQAYGTGERPTITSPKNYFNRTQPFSGVYLGSGSSYITVLDLRIQDAPSGPAVLMTSKTDHLVIAGVEVVRGGAGIGVAGEHQTIVSNYVHDGVMAVDTGDGSKDWGANGITFYGKDIEIAYNRLVNCVAPSKAFGEDGGAFELFSYQPVEEGTLGYNYESDDIRIHHNFVDHAKGFMEGAGKVKNLKIAYNLYINGENTALVLHVNNVVSDGYMQMRVENNTFYSADANPWGYGLLIQYLKAGSTEAEKTKSKIELRNNIWATNSSIDKWTNPLGSNVIHENNLYYFYGSGKFHNDNWKLNASEKLANAKFANPAAKDFRLLSGSPAIDAGKPPLYAVDLAGVASQTGSAADMGAYEWH